MLRKIAVTGHRPSKLRGGYDIYSPENIKLGKAIRDYLLEFLDMGESIYLYSGMAIGVDTIFAMVGLKLKEEYPDRVTIESAIPCRGQEKLWNQQDRNRYREILEKADRVTLVTDSEYNSSVMQKRNEYMVDNCDLLLAIWTGSSGGTGNCVNYARRERKMIYQIHPHTYEQKWVDDYKEGAEEYEEIS